MNLPERIGLAMSVVVVALWAGNYQLRFSILNSYRIQAIYQHYLKHQTMLKWLVLFLAISGCLAAINIDLTQNNKYNNQTIYDTPCNKDSQIDYFWSSNSKLACTTTSCTPTGLSSSTMKYLDINGNDLVLTLVDAQTVSGTDLNVKGYAVNPEYYYLFRFANDGNANTVVAAVPIITSASTNPNVISTAKISDGTFSGLQSTAATSLDLTTFNFMNMQDYGKFYHVTNSDKTVTMLIGSIIYRLPGKVLATAPLSSSYSFSPDYLGSGNKLCYASNEVQGLFQTHLRESWPLWTWIISIMFYWLYYLIADSDTHECYDKRFEENKMTCWGFYSVHYLGHLEYFTRLSRISLMYFMFSLQAVILAALYSTLGDNNTPYTKFEIIIWTAAIAFGATLPVPFILGGFFLQGIYKATLEKFRIIKKSRGVMMNKAEQEQIYEQEIDKLEERTYSYYYWYYILIFAGMVCFWVPSIYMMMQLHRNWYYLHRIWLASLAITFVLDNLIFDPLFSFLLGNTRFYRIRGYFYNFALGQEYKEIEE